MARYKLIGNELVIVNNTNRNEIMPNTYKIAKNRENLSSQINQKKAADLKYFEMQKIKNSSYYKNEYNNQLSKRKSIQNDIQKSTYEKGVQTTVTPFSTQRNILPTQDQTDIVRNGKFEMAAGQDKLAQNKNIENKYQEIKKSSEYKNQMKQLEDQSNKVGYAKYNYDKQRVAEENINGYDKSIGRLNAGFKSIFDYSGGLIKNENGDLEYLPTFNQMKHQKVMESYDTGLGRFAGTTLYEGGKIAGATLINAALPKVGSTMYFGKMFVDSTNQAVSDGYDSGSATIYGLVNVGLEYGVGKALGSATKGLTGGRTNEYKQLLEKTFTNITKKPKLANILANAGSEATEEFIQEYLDNFNKLITLEKSTNAKDYVSVLFDSDVLSDALYSAAVGSVTGGVIGTITGKDTNVDNKDINLYKVYKEELEETKKNTTNKDTIDKIDKVISNIDSTINNDLGVNTKIAPIISQINEYETLKGQNRLTSEQEIELNRLKNQLNAIQNQNYDTSTSIKEEVNLPTVQDIVNQEKETKNSINLPVYNEQSNIVNSDKSILPKENDFNSSNINMPTSNLKIDMTKIKPEILEDIKGFILGDPSIEGYKGSYIKTMLNEVGIRVPAAMNYVSEVRSDMSFTTTKNLTRQQYASIGNALQKLRSVDVTSVNNANQVSIINNVVPINSSLINKTKVNDTLNYSNKTSLSFAEQLDLWAQGKWNNRSQLVLFRHTPQLYLDLGLSDKPITVSSSKLERIINNTGKQKGTYHNLGIETVKQLPSAIANPLNILESSTVKDSIVVVTELSDNDGKIIVVSMALDGKGHIEITDINNKNEIKRLDANVMTSAYGRNNYEMWMEQNKERIIYDIDDGIIKKRINGEWLQLPKGINSSIANVSTGSTNVGTLPVTETSAFSSSNIPQSNNNVNSDTSSTTKYSMPIGRNNSQELENDSFSYKQKQLDIIKNNNPVNDDYHTWIRNIEDIKTLEETINDSDWSDYDEYNPDLTRQDIENAIENGKITVYSSYPIKQGIFVSPSKIEAESYSSNGKVYSKEVNINDVAWIDPTQGQYAKVSSDILPVLDVTSINNTNKAILPIDISQIKQVKGNIPINQELLNKYPNVKEIFKNEKNNYDGNVKINNEIVELSNFDINKINIGDLKKLANDIFIKYNQKDTFENAGNKIVVNKSGINESIEKIYNNRTQRSLIKEHLQVFSDLGDIIENATLVNQTRETKNRKNINYWNYYFDGLEINGELYYLEFDVRSMENGENQYRVQRLEKKMKKTGDYDGDISNRTNILPPYSQPAFSTDNIPQSNEKVKSDILPTINNMQNSEKNSQKINLLLKNLLLIKKQTIYLKIQLKRVPMTSQNN